MELCRIRVNFRISGVAYYMNALPIDVLRNVASFDSSRALVSSVRDHDVKSAFVQEGGEVVYTDLSTVKLWGNVWDKVKKLRLVSQPYVRLPKCLEELVIDCRIKGVQIPQSVKRIFLTLHGDISKQDVPNHVRVVPTYGVESVGEGGGEGYPEKVGRDPDIGEYMRKDTDKYMFDGRTY